jgi:hypothetical protein
MSKTADTDRVRNNILNSIDKREKTYIYFIPAGAVIESLFMLAFIMWADFSNPLHKLLFIATMASYSIVIMGIFGLAFYVNRILQRILKAIELMEQKQSNS